MASSRFSFLFRICPPFPSLYPPESVIAKTQPAACAKPNRPTQSQGRMGETKESRVIVDENDISRVEVKYLVHCAPISLEGVG